MGEPGRDGHPTASREPAGGLGAAVACLAFVLVALALEVVGGSFANSPSPSWTHRLVPLTWPAAARVAWWLTVAAAAAAFRLLLGRAGLAPRRWVTVLAVAPFVVFAAGVAFGAEWATWH